MLFFAIFVLFLTFEFVLFLTIEFRNDDRNNFENNKIVFGHKGIRKPHDGNFISNNV